MVEDEDEVLNYVDKVVLRILALLPPAAAIVSVMGLLLVGVISETLLVPGLRRRKC